MIELNYKVGRNMKLNEKRIVNDIRLLALDMINAAGSGHPDRMFVYIIKVSALRKQTKRAHNT